MADAGKVKWRNRVGWIELVVQRVGRIGSVRRRAVDLIGAGDVIAPAVIRQHAEVVIE
jgi:hypothetical protein